MSDLEWTHYGDEQYESFTCDSSYEVWRDNASRFWCASAIKDGLWVVARPFGTMREAQVWCEEQEVER